MCRIFQNSWEKNAEAVCRRKNRSTAFPKLLFQLHLDIVRLRLWRPLFCSCLFIIQKWRKFQLILKKYLNSDILVFGCSDNLIRPHRLGVRTPAFQAENPGSIPRGATQKE